MPRAGQDGRVLDACDERGGEALRHDRDHPRRRAQGGGDARGAPRKIRRAGPGGVLRQDRRAGGVAMSLRTIGTIYGKELTDSLRDRRTLISMIVLPTVIMPLLLFGL